MKYFNIVAIIAMFCLFGFEGNAQSEQEKLDLPGDNLNLYSVLKIFQESETLEGFEKTLNDESSKINNLDLNGDDKIDYIKVADKQEGEIHNITLKVAVNKDEEQDVAVFVVKKNKEGGAEIQVIGDEDLYGKDYIIEPNIGSGENSTPNPGYTGTRNSPEIQYTTTSEISNWPVISYIYEPSYTGWYSPWDWNYYPSYWHPWRPSYWHYYYGYHYHWNYFYNSHYRRWHNYRFPGWRENYYSGGFRSRSPFVQSRFNRGDFNRTYAKPALARKGSDEFRKDHPKAPTVNNQLPSFDETGRPVVKRPDPTRPVTSPVATKPDAPVTTSPSVTKPDPVASTPETKPVTKPANTRPEKKETDVNNPTITKPVSVKPAEARPEAKPVETRPETKPAEARPETKPAPARPRVTEPVITRPPEKRSNTNNFPVTRPVSPTPPAARPVPARPPETRPPNTSRSNKNRDQ